MDEWMLTVAVLALSLGIVVLCAVAIQLALRLREQDEPGRYYAFRTHRSTGAPEPPHQGSSSHLHGHVSRRPEAPPHGHQPRTASKANPK